MSSIRITKAQARTVAELLERSPKSARYTLEDTGRGLALWDREPGSHVKIRIARNGNHSRPVYRSLGEFER